MEKYNGYTNQFTWLVAVWWLNHEHTQEWLKKLINSCQDVYELEKKIYSFISELRYEYHMNSQGNGVNANMLFDILGLAIDYVDYHQLASNWFEDYKE